MAEFVTFDVHDDGIGTIHLHRPPMNALNRQMQQELRAAAEAASGDQAVRVVIVYGGEKVFAAGADIKEMIDLSYEEAKPVIPDLQSDLGVLSEIPQPTVAAITGYALGGGLEVALAADWRIAGDNVKLGFPEILLGIIPGGGGTQRAARLIGPAKTKDLVYTGRHVQAEEALHMGLIDQVVAPDDVYAAAVHWASKFVHGPAAALAAAKTAIDEGLETDIQQGLHIEAHQFAELFRTEDRSIGMRSFLENGPGKAQFTGK